MTGFRTSLVVALAAVSPALLSATTLEKQDLASVSSQADRIFVARVASTQACWDQAEGQIFTTVVFDVIEGIKNATPGQRVTLRFIGGMAIVPGRDVQTLQVPGVPQFADGERVLLFAMDDPRLFCPVAGWFQGAFEVVRDPKSGEDVVADHEGRYVTALPGNEAQVDARGEGRVTLDAFRSRVLGLIETAAAAPAPATDTNSPELVHGECAEGGHGELCVTPFAVPSRNDRPMESRGSRGPTIGLGLALLALGCGALAWSARQGRKAGAR